MLMKTLVVIPVRDFADAKSRLEPLLEPSRREGLARWLCERTLMFFRDRMPEQDVLVVTACETIAQLASSYGAAVLREPYASGMSAAAQLAAEWSCAHGYDSQLLIPADIAQLDEVELRTLINHPRPVPSVLISPAHDRGTNALLTTPPNVLPFHFGPYSSDQHRNAAQQRGITCSLVHLPKLRFDIDTPDDLAHLASQSNKPAHQSEAACGDLPSPAPQPGAASAPAPSRPQGLSMLALAGIGDIRPGDDLADILVKAIQGNDVQLKDGDILVIAHKVVSKAEGQVVSLETIKPGEEARQLATQLNKDPRKVEVILRESRRVVRSFKHPQQAEGVLIAEHRLGFICANAAVDESNVGEENTVILLPRDPDNSARRLCAALEETFAVRLGVVITDTFGRPWRMGLVNVAIGLANVPAQVSLVGDQDAFGRELAVTIPALADEIAAASGLLMSKNGKTPAILFQGVDWEPAHSSATDLIRPQKEDLFR